MRRFWIAAASAGALALASCASNMETAAADDTNVANASAISALAAGTPAAATALLSTGAYVTAAGLGDMYEIQSSRLALTLAASPAVKDFARQMVTDHTATSQALARALEAPDAPALATLPTALDSRRQAMLTALSSTSGPDFDRLYLQQQLTAHQEAVALHRAYAQNGDNPLLRALAAQIVPKVVQHLEMAQSIAA
jgi:putative membrane protein